MSALKQGSTGAISGCVKYLSAGGRTDNRSGLIYYLLCVELDDVPAEVLGGK